MTHSVRVARRAMTTAIATAGLAAGSLFVAATAVADPPNCTAADLAAVSSGVTAATSVYLHTHPEVNWFFTSLKGQPKDEIRSQVSAWLDDHPQVRAELQGIRQPMVDFRERCA